MLATFPQDVHQTLFAEFLSCVVERLGCAIGMQDSFDYKFLACNDPKVVRAGLSKSALLPCAALPSRGKSRRSVTMIAT